jgi:hypothetical protein
MMSPSGRELSTDPRTGELALVAARPLYCCALLAIMTSCGSAREPNAPSVSSPAPIPNAPPSRAPFREQWQRRLDAVFQNGSLIPDRGDRLVQDGLMTTAQRDALIDFPETFRRLVSGYPTYRKLTEMDCRLVDGPEGVAFQVLCETQCDTSGAPVGQYEECARILRMVLRFRSDRLEVYEYNNDNFCHCLHLIK